MFCRVILAASMLTLVATTVRAQEMLPGLWEISTTMKVQGMQMPGNRFSHCFTAQDVARGMQYSGGDHKCVISNLKTTGGNVSFDMACPTEGGRITGSAKGTVAPTTYTFEQKVRMTHDQGMGEMLQTMTGRRLGDCK